MLDAPASEVPLQASGRELSSMVGHQMPRSRARAHHRLPQNSTDPLGGGLPWEHRDRQDRTAEGVDHGADVDGDETEQALHDRQVHEPDVVRPSRNDADAHSTNNPPRDWSRSTRSSLLEDALHARPGDLQAQSSQHVGDPARTPFGLIEAKQPGDFVDQIRKPMNEATACNESLPRLLERLQPAEQRPLAHDEGLGRSSQRDPVSLPVPQDSKPFPWPVPWTSTPGKSAQPLPEDVVLGLKAANILLQRTQQAFAGSAVPEDDALNSGEDARSSHEGTGPTTTDCLVTHPWTPLGGSRALSRRSAIEVALELCRRHDENPLVFPKVEQVAVTRHYVRCSPRKGRRHVLVVVGVSAHPEAGKIGDQVGQHYEVLQPELRNEAGVKGFLDPGVRERALDFRDDRGRQNEALQTFVWVAKLAG